MDVCEKCGCDHDGSFGTGRFCSIACSKSRVRSEEYKIKISNIMSNSKKVRDSNSTSIGKQKKDRIVNICKGCDKEFSVIPSRSYKKFCSDDCSRKNRGGYRDGSGRAKSGYYKGIYCGSTYELVWVIYQIDHNKEFSRFEKTLEYNGKKYIPDFLQDGKIIEIKGYEKQDSVDLKTEVANNNGYSVLVKRKEDLTDEFNWVEKNYSYKYLQELYDDYKPKYEYVCACCRETFTTEKKRKKDISFCSRKCSGTYVNKIYCYKDIAPVD